MNRVNARLNGAKGGVTRSAGSKVPQFTFPPVDLAGNEKFQKTCYTLWKDGVLSAQTLLQIHGYDVDQEVERKQREQADGTTEALGGEKRDSGSASNGDRKPGRPEMDDSERKSDPAKSQTGKQPKPSNPEGST